MFSEAYLSLCKKHEKMLREGWKPKFGDLVIESERLTVITGVDEDDIMVDYRQHGAAWCRKRELIPVPSQRQLIELLEERGYSGELHFDLPTQIGDEAGMYSVEIWRRHVPIERYGQSHIEIETIGPDPECALLRAWLEACKEKP